jgi:hypothetical protein
MDHEENVKLCIENALGIFPEWVLDIDREAAVDNAPDCTNDCLFSKTYGNLEQTHRAARGAGFALPETQFLVRTRRRSDPAQDGLFLRSSTTLGTSQASDIKFTKSSSLGADLIGILYQRPGTEELVLKVQRTGNQHHRTSMA